MLLCLFLLNKLLLLLLLLLLSPLLLSCKQIQSNGYISPHIRSITKITTSRTLSEFDKYKSNYDDDPEMKEVMKRYNERTAVRLKEYDERKKEKQKEYKEKSDKVIQEIIVKDKIQKQLTKQFSALEKLTDTDHLFKGKNEKKVATKGKKGHNKSKKTLGHTLSEWNILPNIDMYEWIPFSSKEAKVDCNIKNIKQALTRVGYIGPNKFVTLGNKDAKDAVDMEHVFSSIMSSSNALFQKYIDKDGTSNGSSLKKQKGFFSFALYALWEILEHIVLPSVAPFLLGKSDDTNGEGGKKLEKCKCVCTGESTCCTADVVTCACACTDVQKCVCASTNACKCAHESNFFTWLNNILHDWEVFCEGLFAIYIIVSILLILYYVLKYYREIKMEKKSKYMKILK
ncbi:rifin [Plasmodium reichenowi]|uniref:Rifin n=1 Tax=Plasmodium reichenowi TaxID=5854 RepID=A0A2P9D4V5_PLARE|nr:rifin [Plasmodium reichenowi]